MIVRNLLPIKAHFFFFMAALGPVLPQLQVYGKQLGISSFIMGIVTGILPVVYLFAKPFFGIVVDWYRDYRKTIFLGLIVTMAACYSCLNLIPSRPTLDFVLPKGAPIKSCDFLNSNTSVVETRCFIEPVMKFEDFLLYPVSNKSICVKNEQFPQRNTSYRLECVDTSEIPDREMLGSLFFWEYVVLLSIGTIAFNVVNSVSDAICFDVIGEEHDYGKQRSWGAVGYGATALLSGYAIDSISEDVNFFLTATGIMLLFIILDLFTCAKLKIPAMPKPEKIWSELGVLMANKGVVTFFVFTVLIGMADGFLTYFLFWYIEDISEEHGTKNIKLLEGAVVAAGTFGGSILFFQIGDNILKILGHVRCFNCCFFFYALRLLLLSTVTTPWTIVAIEFVLQGPTFALTYITIVAYANDIAPPGASATMQGIAAGLDDGLGYALGSFFGGILYRYTGPRRTFQIFSLLIALSGASHYLIQKLVLREAGKTTSPEAARFINRSEGV